MLGLATVRDWLVLAVPCRQDEPPGYRHDDHHVVQAHVRHVDQIHREDLVPDLMQTRIRICFSNKISRSLRRRESKDSAAHKAVLSRYT